MGYLVAENGYDVKTARGVEFALHFEIQTGNGADFLLFLWGDGFLGQAKICRGAIFHFDKNYAVAVKRNYVYLPYWTGEIAVENFITLGGQKLARSIFIYLAFDAIELATQIFIAVICRFHNLIISSKISVGKQNVMFWTGRLF